MASIGQVLRENMCVGCGACQFAAPDRFSVSENRQGWMQAQPVPGSSEPAALARVCPFSGEGQDETEIAAEEWPQLPVNGKIGRYAATIACHATDEALRLRGGSGGLVTWIAQELLRRGDVDAVVHVQPASAGEERLFRYAISRTEEEVQNGSKSRYYSVTLAGVLAEVMRNRERVAIIGVPCFLTAVRLLIREGHLHRDRAPYLIGLVCGHMKSRYFAEYLAWQKGVAPGTLTGFDFRHKLMDRPASSYGFELRTEERAETHAMSSVRGRDWGEGLFKLPACEYCDDVIAECADIAIGDAWLPEFVADPRGTNVAVIRNARIGEIVAEGRRSGSLHVTDISVADVIKSQKSGLRHRREGLSHRLARRKAQGLWLPRKRVGPRLALSGRRRAIYDLRLRITLESNDAFADAREAGDISVFETRMRPVLHALNQAARHPYPLRLAKRLRDRLKAALRRR